MSYLQRPAGHEDEFQAGMEEQDQRYWRRNANRRVRKKRITRNFARLSLIVSLQLGFGSLVVYTAHEAWKQLSRSEEFSLKRIELAGADRAKSERIEASVAPFLGDAVLGLNLGEIEQVVRRGSLGVARMDRCIVSFDRRPQACCVLSVGGLRQGEHRSHH